MQWAGQVPLARYAAEWWRAGVLDDTGFRALAHRPPAWPRDHHAVAGKVDPDDADLQLAAASVSIQCLVTDWEGVT